jgi:hypothetical protein
MSKIYRQPAQVLCYIQTIFNKEIMLAAEILDILYWGDLTIFLQHFTLLTPEI